MSIAAAFVFTLAAYCVLGLLFAVAFAVRGVGRIDPAATRAGIGFRLLIVPGAMVFWPLLLRLWMERAA